MWPLLCSALPHFLTEMPLLMCLSTWLPAPTTCYLFIYSGCAGSSLQCAGFSRPWLLSSQSLSSRPTGFSNRRSRALERSLSSCGARAQLPMLCGIFLDSGSNPCPLHWREDFQLLDHQRSPQRHFWWLKCKLFCLNFYPSSILTIFVTVGNLLLNLPESVFLNSCGYQEKMKRLYL